MTDTGTDAQTQYVAGTVGDDVLTVHKLKATPNARGAATLEPVCPVPGAEPTQWLRAVNCADCLAVVG
ncbi:hypothetical protein [Streptomyces liangshanensis]|uniref:Uncharacterized protein n=1 Tax=Streptomyces liangshanensis TaxID=2717324 RepID=A0A6G9H1X5_9ACTN|nr:hypothetical protein [Streptomyces liangshanensis]QIQ04528.1 hypothetical protein HA039_21515 [Streptomyces liangshanensis]